MVTEILELLFRWNRLGRVASFSFREQKQREAPARKSIRVLICRGDISSSCMVLICKMGGGLAEFGILS